MIYLLDGSEFNITNVVEFLDTDKNVITYYNGFNMQQTILDKLLEGIKTNQLIHTQWLRGIGKTHVLVALAKELNCIVLEPNVGTASTIAKRENYSKVFSASLDFLRGNTLNNYGYEYSKDKPLEVFVDEGVTNIQAIEDIGFKVITGFYTPKKEDDMSFNEKVTKTLMNEIEALTPKLQQTRDNKDYGTYKNLINAYREVLNLMRYFPDNH